MLGLFLCCEVLFLIIAVSGQQGVSKKSCVLVFTGALEAHIAGPGEMADCSQSPFLAEQMMCCSLALSLTVLAASQMVIDEVMMEV